MGRGQQTQTASDNSRQLLFGPRKASDGAAKKFERQRAAWRTCFEQLRAGDPTDALARWAAGRSSPAQTDQLQRGLVSWRLNTWLAGLPAVDPATKGKRKALAHEQTILRQAARELLASVPEGAIQAEKFIRAPVPLQTLLTKSGHGPLAEQLVLQEVANMSTTADPDELEAIDKLIHIGHKRLAEQLVVKEVPKIPTFADPDKIGHSLDICFRALVLHEEYDNQKSKSGNTNDHFLSEAEIMSVKRAIAQAAPDRLERGRRGFAWTVEERITELSDAYLVRFGQSALDPTRLAPRYRERAVAVIMGEQTYRFRDVDQIRHRATAEVNEHLLDELTARLIKVPEAQIFAELISDETRQWFTDKWKKADQTTRDELITSGRATAAGVPHLLHEQLRGALLADLQAFDASHDPAKCRTKFEHTLRESLQQVWKPFFDQQKERTKAEKRRQIAQAHQAAKARAEKARAENSRS